MSDNFIKRILKKPPVIFPWVALFHIGILLFSVYLFSSQPIDAWVQPLWMLAYTVCWLFVCDMKRWAALSYLFLTTLNLILRFTLEPIDARLYADAWFPADVLFTFFIMFYYKQFE